MTEKRARVSGFEVLLEDELLGVHYWVQYYRYRVPAMEIFEYIGRTEDNLFYLFRSRTEDTIMIRTWGDLQTPDFKAFLLNIPKLQATLAAEEEKK